MVSSLVSAGQRETGGSAYLDGGGACTRQHLLCGIYPTSFHVPCSCIHALLALSICLLVSI